MPTVAVDKEDLWERLGHKYCNYAPYTLAQVIADIICASPRGVR